MALAGFLQPLQPLATAPVNAAPAAGAAPTMAAAALTDFIVTPQEQAEWCWAAVSSSVGNFYGQASWTQCAVASAELTPLNCCGDAAAGDCNKPWRLDTALRSVGHFDRMTSASLAFDAVQAEINARRPVGCRIAWAGGGAHFVALGGWLIAGNGTQYVDVRDSFYGPTRKRYVDLVSAYKSPGDEWSHSYFTTDRAIAVAAAPSPDPDSPISA